MFWPSIIFKHSFFFSFTFLLVYSLGEQTLDVKYCSNLMDLVKMQVAKWDIEPHHVPESPIEAHAIMGAYFPTLFLNIAITIT